MPMLVNISTNNGKICRTDNTTRFYKEVNKYPTLSKEDEIEWFRKLHNGTDEEKSFAREYIINCNQRLVISVAKQWATPDNLTDYINEINIGLIEAVERFDETRGVRFCSYAMWYMVRAVNRFNNETLPMVRRTNQSKTFHVIAKARNKFSQENEREPSDKELMDILNTEYNKDVKDKYDVMDIRSVSIDDTSSSDDSYKVNETTLFNDKTSSINEYEVKIDGEYNAALIESLLNCLPEREKKVIKLRFGLVETNGVKRCLGFSDIAEELGITAERVRQLSVSGLKKIKEEYRRRLSL